MSGTILSPVSVWNNFSVDGKIEYTLLSERTEGGVIISEIYLEGRAVADGRVKIFACVAEPVKYGGFSNGEILTSKSADSKCSAVLVAHDFKDGADSQFIVNLAKKGYFAMAVDLAGEENGKAKYTVYPESLAYANLNKSVHGKIEFEGEVKDTCWYEWSCVLRYGISFLKKLPFVSAVGAIGINDGAYTLWQAAAFSEELSASVFVGGSGWTAYRGVDKFAGVEPTFTDDALKYLAGVEPQAYAAHIKCPVLLLASTNSREYNVDRAYDTVSRIKEEIYTAVNYSAGSRESVDYNCYNDILIFLSKYLSDKSVASLAGEVFIKGEIKDGKLYAYVSPDRTDLKELVLYVSEGNISPELRSWRKVGEIAENDDEKYVFVYKPFPKSGAVYYYAQASYKNGLKICSIIGSKKYAADEVEPSNKHKIIYSSRLADVESMFASAVENTEFPYGLETSEETAVQVKKGALDLYGITAKNGLLTFKINAERFRPDEDSIMMLDVYKKEGGLVTVRLISDYFTEHTVYFATEKTSGGEVWRNIKFECSNFKTEEGKTLKSYDKIQAIEIFVDGEFAVNNLLWV